MANFGQLHDEITSEISAIFIEYVFVPVINQVILGNAQVTITQCQITLLLGNSTSLFHITIKLQSSGITKF